MVLIVLASGLAGALVAGLAERVAYRPIRNSGRLVALMTAIGVSFLLQNLANFIRNGNPLTYTGLVDRICQHRLAVGTSGIRAIGFVHVAVSLLMMLGFWHVVRSTRFGKAMRATSLDLDAARLMGIDVDVVIRNTFLAAGFFAGVAGALVSLAGQVEPMMGFMPGLNAFVAAVVGGIGSIPGALVGGYVLGIAQYLVVWAGVPTDYKDVASFVLLILVLVLRPQGILGRRYAEKV
jgi:branched-chain amino acid transport system permease protein